MQMEGIDSVDHRIPVRDLEKQQEKSYDTITGNHKRPQECPHI